jgi:hypothetical protein
LPSADWSYASEAIEERFAVGFLTAGAADMIVGTKHVQRTSATTADNLAQPSFRNV